ncbi:uncharacterized protein F4822DRAFT_195948 [Hypoxylon trugodes]|uniref:uncharacterized protein n=1 Tax=Hypoxylon trugodes TaxID=326681 RepID=UPI00219E32F8|nr:uncharacterized protein F4822DRAFT_195948 [Hypoxylon trugodes]KAI1389293.1 hypothetical protein F4822DRAFT_195948 [Hypoxylon trugodes]
MVYIGSPTYHRQAFVTMLYIESCSNRTPAQPENDLGQGTDANTNSAYRGYFPGCQHHSLEQSSGFTFQAGIDISAFPIPSPSPPIESYIGACPQMAIFPDIGQPVEPTSPGHSCPYDQDQFAMLSPGQFNEHDEQLSTIVLDQVQLATPNLDEPGFLDYHRLTMSNPDQGQVPALYFEQPGFSGFDELVTSSFNQNQLAALSHTHSDLSSHQFDTSSLDQTQFNTFNSGQYDSSDCSQFTASTLNQPDPSGYDLAGAVSPSQSIMSASPSQPTSPDEFTPPSAGSSRSLHYCKECGREFQYDKDLARHLNTTKVHGNLQHYHCACGKGKQSRKDNHKRHVKNCEKKKQGGRYRCKCGDEDTHENDHLRHVKSCGRRRVGRPPCPRGRAASGPSPA